METMYPCSPLIPFPTQHEGNSYLLWSPQLVASQENAGMYGHGGPSPVDQRQDHEFLDIMAQLQDATDLVQDDFPNADPLLAPGCEEEMLLAREEYGDLAAVEEANSLRDLLLAGAKAVEAGDSIHASAIMTKLDGILLPGIVYRRYDAAGSSLDHLAHYFARGLRPWIAGERTECQPSALPPPAANRLTAYQMLQELSPFTKFAHFTANQAILEATVDDPAVHVVDFNVGDGVQWSSLMSDLASRHGCKPFHLTALKTGTGAGMHSVAAPARWLSEFAESLNLPFRYDEQDLHEFAKNLNSGGSSSPVIVSCDATKMSHASMDTSRMLQLLLGSVKIMQPKAKLVILIEDELFRVGGKPCVADCSFVQFFDDALHHFSAVLDSLASCFCRGGYELCLRLVEEEVLGPRIEGAVAGWHGSMTGGVGSVAAGLLDLGLRAYGVSGFSIAQAKMLTGLFSTGFGIVHDKGRLALCWRGRPLTSVSVWSPVSKRSFGV